MTPPDPLKPLAGKRLEKRSPPKPGSAPKISGGAVKPPALGPRRPAPALDPSQAIKAAHGPNITPKSSPSASPWAKLTHAQRAGAVSVLALILIIAGYLALRPAPAPLPPPAKPKRELSNFEKRQLLSKQALETMNNRVQPPVAPNAPFRSSATSQASDYALDSLNRPRTGVRFAEPARSPPPAIIPAPPQPQPPAAAPAASSPPNGSN